MSFENHCLALKSCCNWDKQRAFKRRLEISACLSRAAILALISVLGLVRDFKRRRFFEAQFRNCTQKTTSFQTLCSIPPPPPPTSRQPRLGHAVFEALFRTCAREQHRLKLSAWLSRAVVLRSHRGTRAGKGSQAKFK